MSQVSLNIALCFSGSPQIWKPSEYPWDLVMVPDIARPKELHLWDLMLKHEAYLIALGSYIANDMSDVMRAWAEK